MNTIGTNIIVGILSGLVSALITYVILELVKKTLIPWYQQITYQGINITGEWYSTVTPFPQNIKLDLSQKAGKVEGIATYVNKPENPGDIEQIRTFRIDGSIMDRFAKMNLRHTDSGRIGVITYLFEIVGDGRKMQGASSHYDLVACKISHADIEFSRVKPSTAKRK